jgi:hypothetical protein
MHCTVKIPVGVMLMSAQPRLSYIAYKRQLASLHVEALEFGFHTELGAEQRIVSRSIDANSARQ